MFNSKLYDGEPVLGDALGRDEWQFRLAQDYPERFGRGLYPRDHYNVPYGSVGTPFDLPLIPRDEWDDRIAEMEDEQTRLSDIILDYDIPEKDQDGVPFCWGFGPTQAYEFTRMWDGLPYKSLSPASGCCPLTNFQARGGWGTEFLKYTVEHGLCESESWPDIAIDRKYDTPENNAQRAENRVLEWWELRPRDLDQMFTCLFHRRACAIGQNHWSHEVVAVDPVKVNGQYGIRFRNQWKGWGFKNFGVFTGSKALADDIFAPRVLVPSV